MPDSSVIPCCVSPYEDHYGNVSSSDIHDIWNNEKFRKLRSQMLAGELPPGCVHCHDLEKAGFLSMREKLNDRFKEDIPAIFEHTDEDGTYTEFKLKYIDIRFSNLCNLKCRGCGPPLSSSWYDDWYHVHGKKPVGPKVKSISADSPGFWKVFQEKVVDAKDVYFGGGEPLITKEHFDVLRLLIEKGKTDVRLSYNTNLSTITYGNHNLADLWGHFSDVTLGISIDDIGKRAEYFRHGTKWPVFEKNLFTMRDQYKKVRRYINCTVNITNVFYLPELYSFLYNERIMDSESFNINLLLGPEEYRIDAIPHHAKLKIKAKLESFLPFLEEKRLFKVKRDFENVVEHMMKEDNSYLHSKFLMATQKLDHVRKESFVDTYPELADILNIKKSDHEIPILYNPNLAGLNAKTELPANLAFAVYDHNSYFPGEDRQQNLHRRTIPSLEKIKFKVISEWEWDAFLTESAEAGKDFALILAAGMVVLDTNAFIKAIEDACDDLAEKKWVMMGHVLDFNDGKLLPYLHEQFALINLKRWKELGSVPLGSLFTSEDGEIREMAASSDHLHSNYTPTFLAPFGDANRIGKYAWGSKIIKASLTAGDGVLNISRPLWSVIKYAYPRDENPLPKQEIDKFVRMKEEAIRADNKSTTSFKLRDFSPKKLFLLNVSDNSMVKRIFHDLTEVTTLEDLSEIKSLIPAREKSVVLIDQDSCPTEELIQRLSELARSLNLRLFRHVDSRVFLLGKGIDFARALVLDPASLVQPDMKLSWKELKVNG